VGNFEKARKGEVAENSREEAVVREEEDGVMIGGLVRFGGSRVSSAHLQFCKHRSLSQSFTILFSRSHACLSIPFIFESHLPTTLSFPKDAIHNADIVQDDAPVSLNGC
jgi:hypothetical protein